MVEKKHPVAISELPSDPYKLGQMVRNFRFDAILRFFLGFLNGVNQDAHADFQANKKRLAWVQDKIRMHLELVMEDYKEAWKIAKPHMHKELEEIPEVQYGQKK